MKPKYDEDFKAQLSAASDAADTGRSDKEERFRKSYLYFACLAPAKQGNEMSSYVEPVLRRAVESVKPSLMNVFAENEKKAVQFRPLTRSNLELDLAATGAGTSIAQLIDNYINKVFINENSGFELLDRSLTEVLVTGDTFLKYFVVEDETEEEFDLVRVTPDVLDAILVDFPDTHDEDLQKEMTRHRDGTISVKFKAERYDKRIVIEFIPFSDIFVSGSYEKIEDARYVCQRMYKTVGELLEMGYDEELVMNSNNYTKLYDNTSTKKLVNLGVFGDEDMNTDVTIDPLEKVVAVYEHYIYSSLVDKKKKKVKLYRVISTDAEILEIEEADRIPFVHGKMEQIPGSFWGVSLYDKFGPVQDILSRLIRSVEFNAADNAYGRYLAVEGMYNKQSLLNNRPGSVIEVKPEFGPQAVTRFEKEQMSPTIDSLVMHLSGGYKTDILSSAGVDVTGSNVSATAAAITANSADLKDKVIARSLAYTLFKPLFEGLYDIIVSENLKIGEIPNPQVMEAQAGVEAGQMDPSVLDSIPQVLPICGEDLPSRSDFVIDVNTANDDAMLNAQLINLMTMFAQVQPGTINAQEVAAQLTGLTVDEAAKFFPEQPAPTPEQQQMEQAAQQLQLEAVALNNELLKGNVGKTAAETFKIEKELELKVEKEKTEILRRQEESMQQFKILEMKEKELNAELGGQEIKVSEYKR